MTFVGFIGFFKFDNSVRLQIPNNIVQLKYTGHEGSNEKFKIGYIRSVSSVFGC